MKKFCISIGLVLAFMWQSGIAQPFDRTHLDAYFDALENSGKFMGSVALSKNGQILYKRSVGFADVDHQIKANEHSIYRIGSISKTFTSVLILKAVEENKLQLNQTIDKYFPTIENSDKITVEQLLRHRSGIHSFTGDEEYLTWNTQPKTEREMMEIIVKGGSDFEPDSKAAYSNSNFVLLSFLLEKIYNQPYSELIKTYITQPLGLTNTYLGGKIDTKRNECLSYEQVDQWQLQPETDISIPLGAGGIASTPVDLVKFSDALFGGKLLKSSSLGLMKTIRDNFGMGLFRIPFYESQGYGHTGGIDGFSSVFAHFSDDNISYALTSNGTKLNNNDISIAVLSAVYNKPFEIPEFTTYQVNAAELDQYLGTYSSKEIPLIITISKDEKSLIAQAVGQPAFPLEPAEKDVFKFEQAGIVMEFNPANGTMILKQSGMQFNYKRE